MRLRALTLTLATALSLFTAAPVLADAKEDYEKATDAAKAGRNDQAIALVSKAIDSKELEGRELVAAFSLRADLYTSTGKYPQAIADFDKAIDLLPDFAEAYLGRGIVYGLQKKYPQAVDDFSRAISLAPQAPQPYFNRGRVLELAGRKDLAIVDYKRARDLDPKMKEAQDALRRLGVR